MSWCRCCEPHAGYSSHVHGEVINIMIMTGVIHMANPNRHGQIFEMAVLTPYLVGQLSGPSLLLKHPPLLAR